MSDLKELSASFHRDQGPCGQLDKAGQALVGLLHGLQMAESPGAFIRCLFSLLWPQLGNEGLRANAITAFVNLHYALSSDVELSVAIEQLEKSIILAALARHRKQKDVYSCLRISRTTLDAKSKKYGFARHLDAFSDQD